MSQPKCGNCGCPTPEVVEIPGSPGANGADGLPGKNAFTNTTADFIIPNIGDSVSISVIDNSWVLMNQVVAIEGAGDSGPGYFRVNSIVGTTVIGLTYLDFSQNTKTGTTITAGAGVSPSADQTNFAAFGNPTTQTNLEAIAYSVTNTIATISGVVLTAPAAGLYLILARATLDMRGVTFSANRTLTLRVRNTTQSTTVETTTRTTGQPTTTDYPSLDYHTPVAAVTLAQGDVLELQIGLDTVQDAGTVQVNSASLCIVPLKLP